MIEDDATLRQKLDKTAEVVGDLRVAQAELDGRITLALDKGTRVEAAVEQVSRKQDAILSELAQTRGVSVERASARKGGVALFSVVIALSALIVTIVQVFGNQ